MIRGIGADLADIARVKRILAEKSGERFLARILTEAELSLAIGKSSRLAEFVSGRFAAKEAVAKALGCGFGSSLGFHDVEIIPDGNGKPHCRLSDKTCVALGVGVSDRMHVTISHTPDMAQAFAVWEQI